MPDVYLTIGQAAPAMIEELARVLEFRAADPQQGAKREAYFADLGLRAAPVLEVGCGAGADYPRSPSSPRPERSSAWIPLPVPWTSRGTSPMRSRMSSSSRATQRRFRSPNGFVDAVVFHTTLCHVPEPEVALGEAVRVLRRGGRLAIFDGDYATLTCATGDSDPLQACATAMVESMVYDRWFARRLPKLVLDAGFHVEHLRGHSYVEAPASAGYMLAIVDRGADALVGSGRIGEDTAAALKAEARRRSDAGEFFGHIGYMSLIAGKPA